MRSVSTYALNNIWEFLKKQSEQSLVLGMIQILDSHRFFSSTYEERMRLIYSWSSACQSVFGEDEGIILPWMHNKLVCCTRSGLDTVLHRITDVEVILQDAFDRQQIDTSPFVSRVVSYDPGISVSDHIGVLHNSMGKEPEVNQSVVLLHTDNLQEITFNVSYSQHFLVNLVARNRGESVSSVLREAVSLLLDAYIDKDVDQ